MADEISKPANLEIIWADGGDKIKPSDEKIQTGWLAEIPTRQAENWVQNRQDTFNAHVNQHGIVVWDEDTNYVASKSYVQYLDGTVYVSTQDSIDEIPSSESQFWDVAFVGVNSSAGDLKYIGYQVRTTDFVAEVNSRYYALSPITVTLPDTAAVGSVVTLYKSPLVTVSIIVNTGVINTNLGTDTTVSYDYFDEINLVYGNNGWEV